MALHGLARGGPPSAAAAVDLTRHSPQLVATQHRRRGPTCRAFCAGRHAAVKVLAIAEPQAQPAERTQQQPPIRAAHRRLTDPAKIVGSHSAKVPVQELGGNVSLDSYMRLPPEQYHELDPALIKALGGKSFLLKVPRVSLFNVWVEPEVEVDVRIADAPLGLIFESGACRLKGSELLERLKLNDRFVIYFHTTLTWSSPAAAAVTNRNGSRNGISSSSSSSSSRSSAGGGMGEISAQSDVQVWSEVIGPFQAIPRSILQATGNAVLGALMRALLPLFLSKLADDYKRWASDPAYRARRAQASS